MSELITYVGIDAHKAQLQVAVLAPDAAEAHHLDGADVFSQIAVQKQDGLFRPPSVARI